MDFLQLNDPTFDCNHIKLMLDRCPADSAKTVWAKNQFGENLFGERRFVENIKMLCICDL
jgi:hypothetical protein